MNVRLICEPCDLWIGFYVDLKKRRLYFLPLPCLGIVFDAGPEWIHGTLPNGLPVRKHWWTREVQLRPQEKEPDFWYPAHESHWKDFKPDAVQPPLISDH